MQLSDLVFGGLALAAVIGAAGVALTRNVLTSAFSLLLSLIGVAGLYGWLGADVAAVAQILVYIGGVLVLILFSIFLTRRIGDDPKSTNPRETLPLALVVGAGALLVLGAVAVGTPWAVVSAPAPVKSAAVGVGRGLLQQWLLPFEVISLVLLAALLGAVAVARKEVKDDPPEAKP